MAIPIKELGKDALINCAKTSMSSKLIGSEANLFSELAVEAAETVKHESIITGEFK